MLYFVIPVYKVEDYLERCVNSVLNQTYKDIHIVLVDDGSPDRCPQMCDELKDKHKNITVIHKPNGGLSDARNAGIDYVCSHAADDDFITFVDSDDYVHKDYAKVLMGLCMEHDCASAQCSYEKGSEDTFSAFDTKDRVFSLTGEEALLNQQLKSQSCAKIYKVSSFCGVRFPVGYLNEDEFTTWKAIYNCNRVAFTGQKLYYYFQHKNSIMDVIAKKLKGNPHRSDWIKAYEERISFFESLKKDVQVMRTHEKICTDIILRYTEQMWLPEDEREESCVNGEYICLYKKSFWKMIFRKGISLKRRFMYIGFKIVPYSAVIFGKIFGLRK